MASQSKTYPIKPEHLFPPSHALFLTRWLGSQSSLFRLAGLGVAVASSWLMTDEKAKRDVAELQISLLY